MNNNTVGNLIKNARLNKGYTQKEIAELLGVTDKAVSKWECGRSYPDITLIESISRELNISVNQLVGVADDFKEEAMMIQQIEKKIRIRLIISAIVFSTILIKLLVRLTGNLSAYWIFSGILEYIIYFIFVIIGGISLISSIILFHKRRKYENNESNE